MTKPCKPTNYPNGVSIGKCIILGPEVANPFSPNIVYVDSDPYEMTGDEDVIIVNVDADINMIAVEDATRIVNIVALGGDATMVPAFGDSILPDEIDQGNARSFVPKQPDTWVDVTPGSFDPASDQVITGEWEFDLTDSDIFIVGGFGENTLFLVQDSSTGFAASRVGASTSEGITTSNTIGELSIFSDLTLGNSQGTLVSLGTREANLSQSTNFIRMTDDGEGNQKLELFSAGESTVDKDPVSPLGIATKRYVDAPNPLITIDAGPSGTVILAANTDYYVFGTRGSLLPLTLPSSQPKGTMIRIWCDAVDGSNILQLLFSGGGGNKFGSGTNYNTSNSLPSADYRGVILTAEWSGNALLGWVISYEEIEILVS